MRVAAIAGAVIAAFVGVMYLRFSGDAVPEREPQPLAIVAADGSVCFVARRSGAPEPTLAPVDGHDRAPCATLPPFEDVGIRPERVLRSTPGFNLLPTPTDYTGLRPNALRTLPLRTGVLGSDAVYPESTAVFFETAACEQGCAGYSLVRVFRRATGSYRNDTVLSVPEQRLPAGIEVVDDANVSQPILTHLISTVDAAEIIAALCTESCGLDGVPVQPGIRLRLFSSVDGGATWTEVGTLTTPEYLAGFTSQSGARDVVIARANEGQKTYRLLRAATPVVPPTPDAVPIFLTDGRILWGAADGRLLWADATVFAVLGEPVGFSAAAAVNDQGQIAIAWRWPLSDSQASTRDFIVLFDAEGTLLRGLALKFPFMPLAWWSEHEVVGSQGHFYNVTSGVGGHVSYIGLGADRSLRGLRLLSVQRGPFAVVRFTDGTCLNIRSQPGPEGTVVDCLADVALLRDLTEIRLIDGVSWLRVLTPTGVEGWASTEYLEARRPWNSI